MLDVWMGQGGRTLHIGNLISRHFLGINSQHYLSNPSAVINVPLTIGLLGRSVVASIGGVIISQLPLHTLHFLWSGNSYCPPLLYRYQDHLPWSYPLKNSKLARTALHTDPPRAESVRLGEFWVDTLTCTVTFDPEQFFQSPHLSICKPLVPSSYFFNSR